MAETGKVTAKQARAIMALLEARSVAEAAATAKVGERTLRRWLTEPTFQAALATAQSEALSMVTVRLTGLLGQSLAIVADRLNGPDEKLQSWGAANVLRHVVALLSYADLEPRIRALEERAEQTDMTLSNGGLQ